MEVSIGSASAVSSLIATAVAESNFGYSVSGIPTQLSLVHTAKVNYDESTGFDAALDAITGNADGAMDEVHALRDVYKADLVVLLISNSDFCGIAWRPTSVSTDNAYHGFSVTGYSCATGYYSFAHEIGHNLGVSHDLYVDTSSAPYAFGHGYVNKADRIRSIMAYNNDCADSGISCTRVNHWSASDRLYNGLYIIGNSATARNNAALSASISTIANYRVGLAATPPSPPTIGTATPGNASASVAFTPGAIGSGTLVNYTASCGGITATGTSSPITVTGLTNNVAYTCTVSTTSTVGTSAWSGATSVTPVAAVGGVNVALSANGGVASASSELGGHPVSSVNNNERTGGNYSNGLSWVATVPSWVQINFNGQKTIDRVVLYSMQDAYTSPVEPTDAQTFSLYGTTGFTVQTWNGSTWVTQATLAGNNLVKRSVTFAAVTTDKIRINVNSALTGYSYITEVEAWTP